MIAISTYTRNPELELDKKVAQFGQEFFEALETVDEWAQRLLEDEMKSHDDNNIGATNAMNKVFPQISQRMRLIMDVQYKSGHEMVFYRVSVVRNQESQKWIWLWDIDTPKNIMKQMMKEKKKK